MLCAYGTVYNAGGDFDFTFFSSHLACFTNCQFVELSKHLKLKKKAMLMSTTRATSLAHTYEMDIRYKYRFRDLAVGLAAFLHPFLLF